MNNSIDITNLHYIRVKKKYVIFSEWCKLPLEIFRYEQDAKDYIKGFKREPVKEQTGAYLKGLEYRRWIDEDVQDGWEFKRYNELDEVIHNVG